MIKNKLTELKESENTGLNKMFTHPLWSNLEKPHKNSFNIRKLGNKSMQL